MALGHLTQLLDGNLRVDLSRSAVAVANVVADMLEREMSVHEALHATVSERVRTGTWDIDTRLPDEVPGTTGHGCRADRVERRMGAQKYLPMGCGWSSVLDVVNEGRTDDGREWIGRGITCLAIADPKALSAPVDVI